MTETGVIFDMDGVLLDTCETHCRTWQEIAARDGKTLTDTDFKWLFGQTSLEIAEYVWGRRFDRDDIIRLELEKEAVFRETFRTHAAIIPGVRELIARLEAAGFRIAIGSSAIRANVDMAIDLLELSGRVESVSCSDVARAKPAPDIFLRAAELLKLPASRCVVIEDSRYGWEAARAAEMKCIAYVAPERGNVDSSLATITVNNYDVVTPQTIIDLLLG
ncbi:MAG: HAD family hydrolase [Thermoguttaceae bacterium]